MAEILLLAAAVSVDGFVSAIGISGAGIRIPFRSAVVISFTGTLFLCAAVMLSDIMAGWISERICDFISKAILLGMGVFNLLHGVIRKKSSEKEYPEAVKIYFDGTRADKDLSKSISCREAVILAAALSADSLITGAGMAGAAILPLMAVSFAAGIISVNAGSYIGRHVIFTGRLNLQWLGGVLLIILALIK